MNTKRSRTYRYRLPRQADWKTVECGDLREARYIVRMEYNNYSSEDRPLPRGTIIERAPLGMAAEAQP